MSPSNEGQTEDLLSAYLEDDLSEAERARVEELLRTSEEARKDLEALRRTVSLLKELEEPEPPPTLWESVSGRLAETGPSAEWAEGAGRARWRRWVRDLFRPAAVTVPVGGAVVAALVLLGVFLQKEQEQRFLLAGRLERVEKELSRERVLRERLTGAIGAERDRRLKTARTLELRNRESDALSYLVSEQLQALAETRAELDRERKFRSVAEERRLLGPGAPSPRMRAALAAPAPPLALEVRVPEIIEADVLRDLFASGGRPWPSSARAGQEGIRSMSVGEKGRALFVLSREKLPALVDRIRGLRGVEVRKPPEVPGSPVNRVLVQVERIRSSSP
ncbi:MAG: zf-HC2 domain-containing protein [bacterium]